MSTVILEMDCGSQICIYDDGSVALPDLSTDVVDITVVENAVQKVRKLFDFIDGKYMLISEHQAVVDALKQRLKKAKGNK
jgi:hypothetical protein